MSKNSYRRPYSEPEDRDHTPFALPEWHNFEAAAELASYLIAAQAQECPFNIDQASLIYFRALGGDPANGQSMPLHLGHELDRLLDEVYWGASEERLGDFADNVVVQRELRAIRDELGTSAVA